MPGTNDVRVKYVDESGKLNEQQFDLIVFAVGMEPSASIVEHASAIGIELNGYGFCKTDRFLPLNTSRPGVFRWRSISGAERYTGNSNTGKRCGFDGDGNACVSSKYSCYEEIIPRRT